MKIGSQLQSSETNKILGQLKAKYSQPNPMIPSMYLIGAYSLTGASVLLAEHNLLWLPISFLLVGTAQHMLFALLHDAAHGLLTKNKQINEFIGNFLVSYPLFIALASFRSTHFAHHWFYGEPQDGHLAYRSKAPHNWSFPMTRKRLIWTCLRYLLGFGFIELINFTLMAYVRWIRAGFPKPTSSVIGLNLFWSSVLGLVIYLDAVMGFVLYWLLPYVVVFQLSNSVREMGEHAGMKHQHDLDFSRIFQLRSGYLIEKLFLPVNNWHLVHHLVPTVPFYHLEKVHKELQEIEHYKNNVPVYTSFFLPSQRAMTPDLLKGPPVKKRLNGWG